MGTDALLRKEEGGSEWFLSSVFVSRNFAILNDFLDLKNFIRRSDDSRWKFSDDKFDSKFQTL